MADLGVAIRDQLPVAISLGALALSVLSYKKSVDTVKRVKGQQGELKAIWKYAHGEVGAVLTLEVSVFNTSPIVPLHFQGLRLFHPMAGSTESEWLGMHEPLLDDQIVTIEVGGKPYVVSTEPLKTSRVDWNSPDPIYSWAETTDSVVLATKVPRSFEPLQNRLKTWDWSPVGGKFFLGQVAAPAKQRRWRKRPKFAFWQWPPWGKLKFWKD